MIYFRVVLFTIFPYLLLFQGLFENRSQTLFIFENLMKRSHDQGRDYTISKVSASHVSGVHLISRQGTWDNLSDRMISPHVRFLLSGFLLKMFLWELSLTISYLKKHIMVMVINNIQSRYCELIIGKVSCRVNNARPTWEDVWQYFYS